MRARPSLPLSFALAQTNSASRSPLNCQRAPRIEEIAIADARVALRRRQRGAAQHHLADHELAVVFAERAFGRAVARIGQIGAARPLPGDAEGVGDQAGARRHLPFRLARQVLAGKAGEGVGLVIADMRDGSRRIDRLQAGERHREPGAIFLSPIAGRLPAFRLHRRPAVRQPERGRRVAAGLDEFEPFGIADEMARDPHIGDQFVMPRRLVVEAEALPLVADGVNAGRHIDKTARTERRRAAAASRRHRPDRSGSARRRAGCR